MRSHEQKKKIALLTWPFKIDHVPNKIGNEQIPGALRPFVPVWSNTEKLLYLKKGIYQKPSLAFPV